MPSNFVQNVQVNTTGSPATPFPGAVTPHNTLGTIIRFGGSSAGGAISVADNINGAWSIVPNFPLDDPATDSLHAWFFQNTAAGTPTVTITSGSPGLTIRALIFEVPTSIISGVIDASNAQTFASSTALSTPTIATTNAQDLLVSCFEGSNGGGGPVTEQAAGSNPASGWFNEADIATEKLYISSVPVLAAGSYLEKWTLTNADIGATGIIAFKQTAGVVPITALDSAGVQILRVRNQPWRW